MMIFAGVCTAIMIPTLPETYAPVILLKKARRLRKQEPVKYKDLYAEHEKQDWSIRGIIKRTLFRPFEMLLKEPILFLVTVYLSMVYGLLYARASLLSFRSKFNTDHLRQSSKPFRLYSLRFGTLLLVMMV